MSAGEPSLLLMICSIWISLYYSVNRAPVGGLVQEILVKDGAKVKKGDLLIRFDTTAAKA
jgi:phosphotransferase system IIA component